MGLGYGQTWQDVSSERSLNVNYVNKTQKPISVNFIVKTSGDSGAYAQIYVDNILVAEELNRYSFHLKIAFATAIIPPSSTYKFSAPYGYNNYSVTELR